MAVAGEWSEAHVRRLFWRAGFGATPTEARQWAEAGRDATLKGILSGKGGLVGPEPVVDGGPLDPVNEWGHDVLWWLDRMVRSQNPLEEKMTLFWHDHFATSDGDTPMLLRQNRLFRKHALGNFGALLEGVTQDPAMQIFLSLADSDKNSPNENYARELMELFTLGSGYSERDIREAARALTGFRANWGSGKLQGIYYQRSAHDSGVKTIFRKRGRFTWRDVLKLALEHRKHAPFLVEKLWSFFIATPIDPATRDRLAALYRSSHYEVRPVLGVILGHPALYENLDQPDMIKAPVVAVAGALRLTGQYVTNPEWTWILESMGQSLFRPPSVAGWDWGPAWLSTNTMRVRFVMASHIIRNSPIEVQEGSTSLGLTTDQALELARQAVGNPWISAKTEQSLRNMADHFLDDVGRRKWQLQPRADQLQMILRHFLLSGPDAQLC